MPIRANLIESCLEYKHDLSGIFLSNACYLCRESYKFEKNYELGKNTETDLGKLNTENWVFVISSIISSVLFLESTINEIYLNVDDSMTEDPILELDKELLRQFRKIQKIFNISGKYRPTLEKYQLFLQIMERDIFNVKISPFQETLAMINLRNYLTHYKPEWQPIGDPKIMRKRQHTLEKLLKGKFDVNPFMKGPGNPFILSRCLGHGCAEWSIISTKNFVTEFYKKLEGKSWFDFSEPDYRTR